jgi:hypothetical protein
MRSIKNAWKSIVAFQMCNLGIEEREAHLKSKAFSEFTTRGLGILLIMVPRPNKMLRFISSYGKRPWNLFGYGLKGQIRCQLLYRVVTTSLGIFS